MKEKVKILFFKFLSTFKPFGEKFFKKKFPERASNILIFSGVHIGDIIRILPAIRMLHQLFPEAKMSILCRHDEKFFEFFPEKKLISEYILYDPQKKHKGIVKKLKLVKFLKRKKFDLIYAPSYGQGMCEKSIMVALIGAPYRIGFKYKGCGFFNNIKIKLQNDLPILKQNLLLLKKDKFSNFDESIQIILPDEDIQFARKLLIKQHVNNFIISVHPGVSWEAKYRCWPIEKFIQLLQKIFHNYENKVKVVILGDKSEILFSHQIPATFKKHFSLIDMIGKTTLGQMMAIIKHSHLFIGNDSGPLHIARAFKIPSIGIFGPTSPKQVISDWENFIPVQKKLPCVPCYLHQPFFKPKCKEPLCLTSLSVDEVWTAVETMLKKVICLNMT